MAKWNNNYYTNDKINGQEVTWDNKVIGWIIAVVFMLILVGPFIFFSDLGGFVQPNPVINSKISLGFVVNKTLSIDELLEKDLSLSTSFLETG